MLKFLILKRQKTIAWFLFILFYSEMAGSVYASRSNYYIPPVFYNYTGSSYTPHTDNYNEAPAIKVTRADEPAAVKQVRAASILKESFGFKNTETKSGPAKTTIGGPGQPEMSTFKSVGADNMVNLFTGDFSYNIPLLDVDGYPINIFYNGGPTMDQEASWVGLGWNINPGTISRNMRGLPDDFDGTDEVVKEQSMKPDVTVGVNGAFGLEAVGYPIGINLSGGVFYNSKRGLGLEAGVAAEFKSQTKIASKVKDEKNTLSSTLSIGAKGGSQTGLTPSISFQTNIQSEDQRNKLGLSTSIDFNSRSGLGDLRIEAERSMYKYQKGNHITFAMPSKLTSDISFARTAFTQIGRAHV